MEFSAGHVCAPCRRRGRRRRVHLCRPPCRYSRQSYSRDPTLAAALIVLRRASSGQLRLAGISVPEGHRVPPLVVREVAPVIVITRNQCARAQRELPYLGTRATFTRARVRRGRGDARRFDDCLSVADRRAPVGAGVGSTGVGSRDRWRARRRRAEGQDRLADIGDGTSRRRHRSAATRGVGACAVDVGADPGRGRGRPRRPGSRCGRRGVGNRRHADRGAVDLSGSADVHESSPTR